MTLKEKARRRMWMLAACTTAVLLGAGGLYAGRKYVVLQRIRALKPQGLAAAKRGDEVTALNDLGPYLLRYPQDVEALEAYARVREDLPEPRLAHIGAAAGFYRQLMAMAPAEISYMHALLRLYDRIQLNTEAVELSEKIIAAKSATVEDYKIQARCLNRLRQFQKAIAAAQDAVKADGDDAEAHLILMQVRLSQNVPARTIVEEYEKLASDAPNDGNLAIVLAYAYDQAGREDDAKRTAAKAAQSVVKGVRGTEILVDLLDKLEMFDKGTEVLELAVSASQDRTLAEDFYKRLVYLGRYEKVANDLAKQDMAARLTSELMGLRAVSLLELGKREEAQKVIAELEGRNGRVDYVSGGWAAVLQANYLTQPQSDRALIKACNLAAGRDPENPLIPLILGESYNRIGEKLTALQQWRNAMELAPVWAKPKTRAAELLHAGRQDALALQLAQAARKVSPDDKQTLLMTALAWTGTLTPESPRAEVEDLLKLVDSVQARYPGEENTLALKISLLMKLGRESEARADAHQIISVVPAASEKTLFSLADASRESGLGLEDDCYAASEKAHGRTPMLAFAQAMGLIKKDRAADALKSFEQARQKGEGSSIEWDTQWAQLLDVAKDPRAKDVWVNLGDNVKGDANIQWLALNSAAARQDHAFTGRTLGRLAALNGDDGLMWRLTKASWLLESTASKDELSQATLMLTEVARSAPDVFAPRLLLAQAYERAGNTSGAITQLAIAVDLAPGALEIDLELARLLIGRGDDVNATRYLKRVTENQRASEEQKRKAAIMLSSYGEEQLALSVLEQLGPAGDASDVLLAELFWKKGNLDQAEKIYRQLLVKPTAPAIEQAAMFFASRGEIKDAEDTLAKLDDLKLEPGIRELVLGTFRARAGRIDEGIALLKTAAKVAPGNVAVRRSLLVALLSAGKIEDALAAVKDACGTSGPLKSDAMCAWISRNPTVFAKLMDDAAARIFLISTVMSPQDDPAVHATTDALALLAQGGDAGIAAVRQAANLNPRCLPLQVLLVQKYMASGKMDDSANLARRTMLTFPDASEPAGYAAAALASLGKWGEVLSTAKEWRDRSSKDPLQADVMIAVAYVGQNRVAEARECLKPYETRAMADPTRYRSLLMTYLQTLVMSNETDHAQELLWKLGPQNSGWWYVTAQLAVESVSDAKVAKAWVTHLTEASQKGTVGEGLMAAITWRKLADRLNDKECLQNARAILEGLMEACKKGKVDEGISAVQEWLQLADRLNDKECLQNARAILEGLMEACKKGKVDEGISAVQEWLQLADRLNDKECLQNARAVLNGLTEATKKGTVKDGLAAAITWRQLAERLNVDKECLQSARSILNGIAARTDVPKEDLSSVNMELAVTYEIEGNPGNATTYYQKSIDLDSSQALAKNNLAMVLANQGMDLEKASTLADQAIKLQPKKPNFYDTLAFVKMKQNDLPEATKNLKTAAELDPKNPLWQINLAEILIQAGDFKGAQSAMDGVDLLSLQPDQRAKLSQLRDKIKVKEAI